MRPQSATTVAPAGDTCIFSGHCVHVAFSPPAPYVPAGHISQRLLPIMPYPGPTMTDWIGVSQLASFVSQPDITVSTGCDHANLPAAILVTYLHDLISHGAHTPLTQPGGDANLTPGPWAFAFVAVTFCDTG